jgi:hypothetical protein
MKRNISKKFVALATIITFLNLIIIPTFNASTEKNDFKTNYDLLIISPKKFARILKPLVNHKNDHGVRTIFNTTEEIYAKFEGRDKAEQIKYFIKYAIESFGIKYVLLVGGRKGQLATENWWVPVRYSYLDRPYGKNAERKFLSDLYFADIYDKNGNFSSWNNNNNSMYGEWPINKTATDIPDLYPDVYVGRLPCRNAFQVRTTVKKIIKYESGKRSDSWFKNMVVVAGDTYPRTPYIDGEVYTQMALDMMTDFRPIKLLVSDHSLQNWKDVAKAINNGCGFIYFSGHGNPTLWGTRNPPEDNSTWVYGPKLKNMPFIINGKKLPVCIVGSGCFNSMFNVSLGKSPWVYGYTIPLCWSEALTYKIDGGCIAVIGSTAFSYESPDINTGFGGIEWLDINFFREYGINKVDILGEAWGKTVTSFIDNFPINWSDNTTKGSALIAKNAEMWLLMGDPSLKIGGYAE